MLATWTNNHTFRGYALLGPALLLIVVGVGASVLALVSYSFWTQDYVTLDRTPTFANYAQIIAHDGLRALLLKTLAMSGCVAVVATLLAYPIAYYIAFHAGPRRFVWLVIISIPFLTSYLLRVLAWTVILGSRGVINGTLVELGFLSEPLQLIHNEFAVIVTLTHAWAPFVILPIVISLQKIDPEIIEAARDLGTSPIKVFLRVTLPLSMPGVTAGLILVFIPTVGDFAAAQLVGGSQGQMMGNVINLQFTKANNWPMGAALSIVSALSVAATIGVVFALLRLWKVARR